MYFRSSGSLLKKTFLPKRGKCVWMFRMQDLNLQSECSHVMVPRVINYGVMNWWVSECSQLWYPGLSKWHGTPTPNCILLLLICGLNAWILNNYIGNNQLMVFENLRLKFFFLKKKQHVLPLWCLFCKKKIILFSIHQRIHFQNTKWLIHGKNQRCMDTNVDEMSLFLSPCDEDSPTQKWRVSHVNHTALALWKDDEEENQELWDTL